MPDLIVRKLVSIPMVGTWKWADEDYRANPLSFTLPRSKGRIFLDPGTPIGSRFREREPVLHAVMEFTFSPPPERLLRGLRLRSGMLAKEAAETIYRCYVALYNEFETVLRTAGQMRNMPVEEPESLATFFEKSRIMTEMVSWRIDGGPETVFEPRIETHRRRLNPLFKSEQILTLAKWKNLQKTIDQKQDTAPEYLELLRIRSKLEWHQEKIAAIEAAVLVEALLRKYAIETLKKSGMSANRIKTVKDEITLNALINIVLPLSLSTTRRSRLDAHVGAVDALRRVRNDIVHGNINETQIDHAVVRDGIDGALVLIEELLK